MKTKIRELEIKIELVKKETEEEKSMFMERDLLNRIKYEELESKYSELQKKAFSLQQEKQKKNKNRVFVNENKSYRMKKVRKMHEMNKANILVNHNQVLSENDDLKGSIKQKAQYLKELMNTIQVLGEKNNKEPGYLRSKSKKTDDVKIESGIKGNSTSRF